MKTFIVGNYMSWIKKKSKLQKMLYLTVLSELSYMNQCLLVIGIFLLNIIILNQFIFAEIEHLLV